MHDWERALAEFITPFRARRDVIAALVCGSYVTGAPGPRSDIDVVIVLSPATRYRERGNRVVRGFLFEYFANPPQQFRKYFEDGHAEHRQNMATMLATGRPLFDDRGALRQLRAQARRTLLVAALGARTRGSMLRAAETLTAHATRALGGFALDGFRSRSPLSL